MHTEREFFEQNFKQGVLPVWAATVSKALNELLRDGMIPLTPVKVSFDGISGPQLLSVCRRVQHLPVVRFEMKLAGVADADLHLADCVGHKLIEAQRDTIKHFAWSPNGHAVVPRGLTCVEHAVIEADTYAPTGAFNALGDMKQLRTLEWCGVLTDYAQEGSRRERLSDASSNMVLQTPGVRCVLDVVPDTLERLVLAGSVFDRYDHRDSEGRFLDALEERVVLPGAAVGARFSKLRVVSLQSVFYVISYAGSARLAELLVLLPALETLDLGPKFGCDGWSRRFGREAVVAGMRASMRGETHIL